MNYSEFLQSSPSSFHAARSVEQMLLTAGFSAQDPKEPYGVEPGGYVQVVDGCVIAWWIPHSANTESGFRIIGSHTDSPGFKLKPHPERSAQGFVQASVEVYGGAIIPSWLDRDLRFAGQVVLRDGRVALVDTGPIARIPHLAIHLDRSTALELDRQAHTRPVVGLMGVSLLEHIALLVDAPADEITALDMISCDTQAPGTLGLNGEFLAAGRQDNLSSVYASVRALVGAIGSHTHTHANAPGKDILVLAAYDHEEVGSASVTGAGGALLEHALKRIAAGVGASEEGYLQMLARSHSVSADAAHSLHPNYPDKHDPDHAPLLGGGPVTKINANQRYASTPQIIARWERACAAANVPSQVFVGNNTVPCGSTIGPISSTRLGIPAVDVGIPLLSMHSARELSGTQDMVWFISALEAYLSQ